MTYVEIIFSLTYVIIIYLFTLHLKTKLYLQFPFLINKVSSYSRLIKDDFETWGFCRPNVLRAPGRALFREVLVIRIPEGDCSYLIELKLHVGYFWNTCCMVN